MIRTLIIALGALSLAGCETTDQSTFAAYDPQAGSPPTVTAIATHAACEKQFRTSALSDGPVQPIVIERCAPRYPRAALDAELTASCVTYVRLHADGSTGVDSTLCNVGGATKPNWRAYGEAVFANAATAAINQYRFDPASVAGLDTQRFAIRTLFVIADFDSPPAPALPVDVVELLQTVPRS